MVFWGERASVEIPARLSTLSFAVSLSFTVRKTTDIRTRRCARVRVSGIFRSDFFFENKTNKKKSPPVRTVVSKRTSRAKNKVTAHKPKFKNRTKYYREIKKLKERALIRGGGSAKARPNPWTTNPLSLADSAHPPPPSCHYRHHRRQNRRRSQ